MALKVAMNELLQFRIKNNFGWLVFIALSLLPTIFWYFSKPISTRFVSLATTLTSLGQITGLVGMAMFALTLILSSRLRFLENYFGGLNRVYIAHHFFGSIAFILLLFHPLILAAKFAQVSIRSAALFLLPSSEWPINFGIIALLLMMVSLVLTFFVKLPYQIWKFSHKFLGLAFFFAALHSFFIPSDISQNIILRIYIMTLAGIGIIAFIYRAVLAKFFVKYFEYSVEEVKILAKNLVEITMSPKGKRINFTPGQFVFVSFVDNNISAESHPFSISSAVSEKNLKLTIKSLGDYTSQLRNLRAGALAKIEGPFGKFSYQNVENKNQVWIAGGIGITPFLSMARSLENAEYKIDLYYCVNNEKEPIFLEELLKISQQNPNFRIIPFYSEKQGFINAEFIQKISGDLNGKEIFLCGPPAMMKSLKEQFLKLKVSRKNIHSEEFQLL
jgi:predicted ferric reductase